MKRKYLIENHGCDDVTFTEIELSEEEANILINFAKMNNKNSSCGCQPTIEIYELQEIKSFNTWKNGKYLRSEELTSKEDVNENKNN